MGRKRIIWLTVAFFVALLVVAVCILWEPGGPPEPIYQGKPLSFWLKSPGTLIRGTIGAPVVYTGTNQINIGVEAFPTLLRMLQVKDNQLKRKLAGIAETLPLIHYHYWRPNSRISFAVKAFYLLRGAAKSAVPELMAIYERRIADESQAAVAEVLGNMGPDAAAAIPMLLNGASNAPARVRAASVQALGEIRTSPGLTVPALIQSMGDADLYVRISAVDAIEKYGDAGKPAVPALVRALGDTNETINASAEEALKIIDRDALEKARKEGKVRPR